MYLEDHIFYCSHSEQWANEGLWKTLAVFNNWTITWSFFVVYSNTLSLVSLINQFIYCQAVSLFGQKSASIWLRSLVKQRLQ